MRITVILCLVVLLHGCTLFNKIEPIDDQVTIHPELPRPINGLQIDWSVIKSNNQIYIGTEYTEFLKMLEFQNDLIRYMDQMNTTVCYYRQDLNEHICRVEDKAE